MNKKKKDTGRTWGGGVSSVRGDDWEAEFFYDISQNQNVYFRRLLLEVHMPFYPVRVGYGYRKIQ